MSHRLAGSSNATGHLRTHTDRLGPASLLSPMVGQPPGLQFGLLFTAVRPRSQGFAHAA
jgi:hypothetical protein